MSGKHAGGLRVIVAGGGTGGHLFPGLAVADGLRAAVAAEVSFIGAARGIESRVVSRHGYPLHLLPIRALRGQGPVETLGAIARLAVSFFASWRLLGALRPHLVVGVGGYASGPAMMAANTRRTPTVLLEQNAFPGATNRWLGRWCDRVCVSFPESAAHFPADRTVETGNPVRPPARRERCGNSRFSILLFGGSAGARRLNQVGVEAFAMLPPGDLRIRHQTGEVDADAVRARYAERGVEAEVVSFIDDMAGAYVDADLIVCRAGATTVAELTALGKPSILVPYPFAADDHQQKNAESLVRRGAAEMILDDELEPERLAAVIEVLRSDRGRLQAMGEASRALGRPDATERVVAVCLQLVSGVVGEGRNV